MKYIDIPKFTRFDYYHVNTHLNYFKSFIDDYIINYNLQLCPDFQRGHVWNRKQQIAYIEYIIRGGISGKTFFFNHPGWMSTFKGDFVLVDGLQRITAILLFLDNELPVFGNTLYKDIEGFKGRWGMNIVFDIWVNNLKTRKEVLTWYLEMNEGGVVHTEEELNKVRKLLEKENCESI